MLDIGRRSVHRFRYDRTAKDLVHGWDGGFSGARDVAGCRGLFWRGGVAEILRAGTGGANRDRAGGGCAARFVGPLFRVSIAQTRSTHQPWRRSRSLNSYETELDI